MPPAPRLTPPNTAQPTHLPAITANRRPSNFNSLSTSANLRAAGWKDGDFDKPVITVASPWSNALPCNIHIRELTDLIVEEVERQGGKAFVAGTPVISDGITNGTDAMKYSLISRDYIADCVEIMHKGYMADALITLGGCDKTVPAAAMPIPRITKPFSLDELLSFVQTNSA